MIDFDKFLLGQFEEVSQEPWAIRLVPDVEWPYFLGHFPQTPVLPAVGIADISQYLIEKLILKKALSLKTLTFFKIKTPVQPGQSLQIEIKKEGDSSFFVVWKNETAQSVSAEFKIDFGSNR